MGEIEEPTQGMLNFIRALLSWRMNEERAKNLSDDEIGWIAPLVINKLNHIRLTERDRNIIILRYGLFGHEPLSYEKVGIQVGEKKPLIRERVRQITARVIKKLSHEIFYMNSNEYNLYALLAGKKGAIPVLNDTIEPKKITADLRYIIGDLIIIQYKYNVRQFIFEKFIQSLDEKTPE